jgi:cupin superfamily acireductone dioxygenase involved in methionine salvage
MRLNEVQLPVIGNQNKNKKNTQIIEDVFHELQTSGFKYLTFGQIELDEDVADDELIEAHHEHIEELMNEDSYEHIEVIRLQNYSAKTGAYVYKPCRDKYETRLITHGQCSLFITINKKVFEFQCRKGEVIRLPATLNYWFEVGVHACRYIHLYMSKDGWDKPTDKQDIQPGMLSIRQKQAV